MTSLTFFLMSEELGEKKGGCLKTLLKKPGLSLCYSGTEKCKNSLTTAWKVGYISRRMDTGFQTLVLNRLWQAVSVVGVERAFVCFPSIMLSYLCRRRKFCVRRGLAVCPLQSLRRLRLVIHRQSKSLFPVSILHSTRDAP